MKTHTLILKDIHESDVWAELTFDLRFEKFKNDNPELGEEDELIDAFYVEEVSKNFKYGDFANLEITFDEDLNIVGGRVIPHKEIGE